MEEQRLAALQRKVELYFRDVIRSTSVPGTKNDLYYSPQSQEDYLRRIASFHWSWASRPPPADVRTAARYGWYGGPKDDADAVTIRCTGCKARLMLPWEEDFHPDAVPIIASEYGEKLMNAGHASSGCPWRIKPADESIGLPKYSFDAKLEMHRLVERTNSFTKAGVHTVPACPPLELNGAIQSMLPSVDINRSHFALAAMQWRAILIKQTEAEAIPLRRITCRFGCNSYGVSTITDTFHPLEGHAWYCPFIEGGGLGSYLAHLERISEGMDEEGTRLPAPNPYDPLLSRFTAERVRDTIS